VRFGLALLGQNPRTVALQPVPFNSAILLYFQFMRKLLIPFALTLLVLDGQTPAKFSLTVDNIMRGPGLVGYEPAQVRWSGDSRQIYFQWKLAAQKESEPMDTYVVGRDGTGLRKLTDEEAKAAPPVLGDTSKDKQLTVWAQNGDLFVYENATGKTRRLTRTLDPELNPRFLQDGKSVSFMRGGNLYVISLENGSLVQMTDIRPFAPPPATPAAVTALGGGRGQGQGGRGVTLPPAGDPPRGTDSQEYLKKQQRELLEAIRDRATRREETEAQQKQENPRKPFILQARQNVAGLQLSPDGKYILATIIETGNARNTIVPNYITESVYTEDIPGRSNVGDTQSRLRLAVIDAITGELKWVDHGQKITPPATSAQQRMEQTTQGTAPPPRTPTPNERDVQLLQPVWSEDGTKAVMIARAGDNKDRWVLALDVATGKTRVLASDHDDAWVAGPGSNTLGWMQNDREVFFQSERTGYSHLYAVPFDGGEPRALTSGKWEVLGVKQSRDKSHFYLTANKDTAYEQHLYEMPGDGGNLTRLTGAPGKHVTTISPDDQWIADIHSYTNKPPELYVQENRARVDPKKLTNSPAPEFWQYPWLDVPVVTFKARDGVQVPVRLFKPANGKRGGPGVVFVHGSGYAQNVDHKWSTYYHEYLFHHILLERGYTVIDVDYRGSAGYGRDWRTAVYEHMGGKDLDDIVDAAKYLASDQGVDPKKIGLYGGSYGGFITLMAMFTQPDVFAAGAALRPVSDWALYNHGYTSDILNVPQSDAEAYRKSSPIYFAEGLKGALLICHGMVDVNVHFQDTVRLVQRLIELRKTNWDLAVYPVEDHGFVQPASWADEYKRILALFEKNLKS
jgi:dipeptidyl aminopeptidase/acylaminoacyl peptidase